MSSSETKSKNSSAPSIRAKMKEIASVRYLGSDDNLSDREREIAKQINYSARASRRMRIENDEYNTTRWTETIPEPQLAMWALHPKTDVFVDLLETDTTSGKVERARLPGVTDSDVKARIELINRALACRLERIEEQETERERGR